MILSCNITANGILIQAGLVVSSISISEIEIREMFKRWMKKNIGNLQRVEKDFLKTRH